MSRVSTIEQAPFGRLKFGEILWEGEDELPSWAGFLPRKSRIALGESGDGRVKVRVQPPKSRAPVVTGRVLLVFFLALLGLKVGAMWSAQLARIMGRVSWWIVGVPLVCYVLVQMMRMIAGKRGTPPTSEQVGAFEFLKQNEAQLGKSVLNAVFEEYPRLRKGFGKDEWEEMGQRIMQVNQAEEMKSLVGPEAVKVMNLAKDGRAYLWWEFNANWDQRGFGVLTHGMRVVEIGPSNGEFEVEAAEKDGGVGIGRGGEEC